MNSSISPSITLFTSDVLVVGTVVLHAAVIEDIAADLASPLYLLLSGLYLGLLLPYGAEAPCRKEWSRSWRMAFSLFFGWSRVSVFSMRISSSSPV